MRGRAAAGSAHSPSTFLEQVPKAAVRALDGVERVSTIVRSMRVFAHPDKADMAPVDLNRAITSTLTIARNDIVVTDLRMPVIDGMAVLAVVKRCAPKTQRVMLSGSDCDSVSAGVDEMLVKPCSAMTLRAALERLLA